MHLQDLYDELDNIVRTLDELIGDIKYCKDYSDELKDTLYRAMNDLEEIEPRLQEQYDREEQELENQYWKEAI